MIRSLKTIFLIISCLLTKVNSFSQYSVKFKGDSIVFEVDSVILTIDNLPGSINWEVSKDTLTWKFLNNNTDSLWIRIDSSAYYRAKLTAGACTPTYSKVALVSFRSIYVTGNSVTIDPAGGVYFLPSGIKLIVPPRAVKENVTVSFDLLDSIKANLEIPFECDSGIVFCTGIYCDPSGIQFLKPIKINVPAPNYQHSDLPYVYLYDSNSGLWGKDTSTLICSENQHFIEFSYDKLASARVHLFKNLFGFGESAKGSKGDNDVCKKGIIQVQSSAHDFIGSYGSTDCYVSSDQTQVAFLDCPGKPTETARIQEIGEYCKPKVKSYFDKPCLNNGESATMTIEVTIGGMSLSNQHITLNLSAGLSTKSLLVVTDKSGQAQFTVTCNDPNFADGNIYYKVYFDYYLQTVEASANGSSENNNSFEEKGEIEGSQPIKGCPVLNSISLSLGNPFMAIKDGGQQLTVQCYDKNGALMDCGAVEYILSSIPQGGVVSVDQNGVITALKPGVANIIARSKNSGIESNSVSVSVAYEGDMNLSKTQDWTLYGYGCGCKPDSVRTFDWAWYILNYTGNIHIQFWLNTDSNQVALARFDGSQRIDYTINSPICKDTSIYQVTSSIGYWSTDLDTKDVIQGTPFNITFNYNYWPAYSNFQPIPGFTPLEDKITMYGHMSTGVVIIDSINFTPEGCVDRVDGSCVLQ
jgi:hypothetical protein